MYQENPALQTRTRSGLRPTSDMLLPGSPFQPFPLSSVLPQRKHPLRQSDSPAERGDTSGCRERGDPNRAEPNRPELERKRREAGGEAAAARAPVTQEENAEKRVRVPLSALRSHIRFFPESRGEVTESVRVTQTVQSEGFKYSP
ncbi:Hypothetical predicted protein [Xyrichtys novacula]|uniref:Uncharacterized protein n=1 Tax=Xyrichtys novacula TaxID=13765 RepID=A0AAV1F1E1_XYRNO|nr:Hypothetical predicted protein [Xyrichtys novacula]